MRISKSLAVVAAGSLAATGLGIALAAPASAVPEGSVLSGNIYWFSQGGGLDNNTAATQISSGVSPTNGANPRPFTSLAIDAQCPAGTLSIQAMVRIPQVGVPEDDWTEVAVTAQDTLKDSQGRFYIQEPPDRLSKSEIFTYTAAHSGTGQFPYMVVCRDVLGNGIGYFQTTLTVTGTTATNYSWSIPAAELPKAATTTTVAASASSVEAGTAVTLTANVSPAAATGSVEFFAGTTSLGTATVNAGVATLSTSALPIGDNSVTAVYAGDSANATSTSAAVTVTVTAAAPRSTTTTLSVSPTSGDAYQSVTFTATVASTVGAPNGTVTFKDGSTTLGSVTVTNGVVPAFTTNVLGAGSHSLTASFVGSAPYTDSASAAVDATYSLVGAVDEQTVVVTIPQGAITITTPYTPASPLDLGTATLDPADSTYSASAAFSDIVITDSRAGNLGFTASVVAGTFEGPAGAAFGGNYAGLTALVATQVADNALQAGSVVVTNHAPYTDGLATPKVFATYAAGQSIGTAHLDGVFGIDQVPTSVQPGLYTSTVTFTAV